MSVILNTCFIAFVLEGNKKPALAIFMHNSFHCVFILGLSEIITAIQGTYLRICLVCEPFDFVGRRVTMFCTWSALLALYVNAMSLFYKQKSYTLVSVKELYTFL